MLTPQTIGLLMLASSVGLAAFVTLSLLLAIRFGGKSATWYYNQAVDACQAGQRGKAIALFLKALHKQADFTDASYNLGLLYLEEERLNEARLQFEQVLQERPQDADTLYNLALLEYADGDMVAVCDFLSRIEELDGDGCYLKGLAHEALEQEEEALLAYQQATVLNPENVNGWLLLGRLYDRRQQQESAVNSFQQVLDLDPNNLDANYELSISLAKQGDWKETLRYSRRAIEIDPHYAKAYNQLGLACYCTDQFEEAIEHYRQAIEIDPQYSNAYNNLGYAYQKAGRYTEAIEAFEEYLRREEPSEETQEIQAHVDSLKQKLLE
jgi:tetratricopeptide (TPR) repeat protein